ncbi:hypothetical protein GCM10022233_44560 [Streptomyces shaanxiensis]|uniref:Uncharacterized protein n=1 Tax=Streptomyces shaanxiensis TaxID=653357 RepID=A0ABP7VDK6_9ACTN
MEINVPVASVGGARVSTSVTSPAELVSRRVVALEPDQRHAAAYSIRLMTPPAGRSAHASLTHGARVLEGEGAGGGKVAQASDGTDAAAQRAIPEHAFRTLVRGRKISLRARARSLRGTGRLSNACSSSGQLPYRAASATSSASSRSGVADDLWMLRESLDLAFMVHPGARTECA